MKQTINPNGKNADQREILFISKVLCIFSDKMNRAPLTIAATELIADNIIHAYA